MVRLRRSRKLRGLISVFVAIVAITEMLSTMIVPVGASNVITIVYGGNGRTHGAIPASHTLSTPGSTTLRHRGRMSRAGYVFQGWRSVSTGNAFSAGGTVRWNSVASGQRRYDAIWRISTYSGFGGRFMRVAWPGTNINIRFNVTSDYWSRQMGQGLTNWNNSIVPVRFNRVTNNPALTNNVATMVRSGVDGAFGIVRWWSSNNAITRFEIELNNDRIRYDRNTTNWANVATSVMVHELGHVAGLSDNPTGSTANNSIMNGNRNRNTVTRLQPFDESSILMIH
ncbi:MAG: hypothetical protein FWF76_01695 [Oscillospiraceae bacterium]|nr:hypothetical protein [Oscillospiraceae bacterium]